MKPTESAILVPVPAAESAVSSWRARLDHSAARGVPAHVTVLYPFLHPERIDDAVLDALAAAVSAVPRFRLELNAVRWFGDSVVWLAPDPDAPFRALTTAVWQQFPETPPFGGEFADVVPHLTVGNDGPEQDMREAAEAVRVLLPISASVDAVHVFCGAPERDSWHSIAELPLRT